MDPVQCWPLRILYADYNRAVRALKSVGVDRFREIGDQLSSLSLFGGCSFTFLSYTVQE
jgi:hypothetical protein